LRCEQLKLTRILQFDQGYQPLREQAATFMEATLCFLNLSRS